MPVLDFSHLTPEQRLQLIDELWDSLDPDTIPLTKAQEAEVRRRLATLDEDVKQGKTWEEFRAELAGRYG